jgi:Leucine-rich repeat (LRR) protein
VNIYVCIIVNCLLISRYLTQTRVISILLKSLGDNELVGQLPWTQLALLNKTLTKFDISSNYLNSTIGTQVGSLSKLVTLRLDNNYRTDADGYLISNGFQGTIPASIGNLNQLVELRLDNNFIAGSLPSSLGKLRNLVTLRAEGNNLKSSIPSELGNLTR